MELEKIRIYEGKEIRENERRKRRRSEQKSEEAGVTNKKGSVKEGK